MAREAACVTLNTCCQIALSQYTCLQQISCQAAHNVATLLEALLIIRPLCPCPADTVLQPPCRAHLIEQHTP